MNATACTIRIPRSGEERHVLSLAADPYGFVPADERTRRVVERLVTAGHLRADRFDATRFYITDAGREARAARGAAA